LSVFHLSQLTRQEFVIAGALQIDRFLMKSNWKTH